MQEPITGFYGAVALSAALWAGGVAAQPLGGKEARAQLFSPKGATVEMMPLAFLTPENTALLNQVAAGYAYYAAVAIAPGEDLLKSEATMLVANQHSTEAASKIALSQCDKARKGKDKCVIAAVVRPEKWQSGRLQLSVEATVAMGKDYGRSGPRALVISPQSGAWALGKGANAAATALGACASKGATDCALAVAD